MSLSLSLSLIAVPVGQSACQSGTMCGFPLAARCLFAQSVSFFLSPGVATDTTCIHMRWAPLACIYLVDKSRDADVSSPAGWHHVWLAGLSRRPPKYVQCRCFLVQHGMSLVTMRAGSSLKRGGTLEITLDQICYPLPRKHNGRRTREPHRPPQNDMVSNLPTLLQPLPTFRPGASPVSSDAKTHPGSLGGGDVRGLLGVRSAAGAGAAGAARAIASAHGDGWGGVGWRPGKNW
jgi:hypothetical protein